MKQPEIDLSEPTDEPGRSRSSLGWVGEGAVRIAPLMALPGILAEHGLDPGPVIARAGCDIALFDDPENTIAFADGGRLLVEVAAASRCPDIGVEIGRRQDLGVLGFLGDAARLAPDVGSALRIIVLYLHLHDRGAVPTLRRHGTRASMGYGLRLPEVPGIELVYDVAMAILLNMLRSLCGPGWVPGEVRLSRRPPVDSRPYRAHFGSRLRFRARFPEAVFRAAELDRPLPGADPAAFEAAVAALDEMAELGASGYAERVRRLLRRLLFADEDPECTHLCQVADLLAVHPRTLNRRLSAEGNSFRELVAQTRFETACQMLRDSPLPIVEVASALGYSEASVFVRAFRRWSGTTPGAWRRANAPD